MPQRLRVKNIQDNADILADLNICANDPRLYRWIDAFEQQALVYGRWWGTTQLVQFCLDDSGCIVLPRQIATIEAANLGKRHAPVRNGWYDFVRPHSLCDVGCCEDRSCGCGCGVVNVMEAGLVASFRTTSSGMKIRVYPGSAADVGKKIIFQGKDENGIWVRTTIDGVRSDGEQVTLALPFVDTVTVWGPGAPFRVIKDPTDYRVLVYGVTQETPVTENPYVGNIDDGLCYQFNAFEIGSSAIVEIGQTPGTCTNTYLVLTDLTDGLKYKLYMVDAPPAVFWEIDPTPVVEDETPTVIMVGSNAYELNTADNGTTVQLTATTSPVDGEEILLADYEPSETEPAYRRVNVENYRRCRTSNACCSTQSLSVIVSLDKIPVQVPNDWLLFSNMEAYRQGLMSIKYRKDGNQALADAFFFGTPRASKNIRGPLRYAEGMGALPILRAELRKYTADVTSVNVNTDGLNLAGFM